MPVEIIYRGTPPEEVWYKGTCNNCSTQVKFQAKDADVSSGIGANQTFTVGCPICLKHNITTKSKYGTSHGYR